MARSSYYYHSKNLKKPDKYSSIKQKIIEIYDEHKGRYGYRRITLELQNQGYNFLTRNYVDMLDEGIIDPCKVTRCALQNAVSAASTLLTMNYAIVDAKD